MSTSRSFVTIPIALLPLFAFACSSSSDGATNQTDASSPDGADDVAAVVDASADAAIDLPTNATLIFKSSGGGFDDASPSDACRPGDRTYTFDIVASTLQLTTCTSIDGGPAGLVVTPSRPLSSGDATTLVGLVDQMQITTPGCAADAPLTTLEVDAPGASPSIYYDDEGQCPADRTKIYAKGFLDYGNELYALLH